MCEQENPRFVFDRFIGNAGKKIVHVARKDLIPAFGIKGAVGINVFVDQPARAAFAAPRTLFALDRLREAFRILFRLIAIGTDDQISMGEHPSF